jgi:YVTN family beta-propeller protein
MGDDLPKVPPPAVPIAATQGIPVFRPGSIGLGAPGAEPIAAYYDPANQAIYIEDAPGVVIEVSALTHERMATVVISNSSEAAIAPASLAFDAAANELWLLGPGALGVSALALSNNSVTHSVLMPTGCEAIGGLAFDPTTGTVWVACLTSILAFSAANGTLLFDQNVSYASGAILYDPQSQQVVASVWLGDSGTQYGLDVFNPDNYTLDENVSTGTNTSGAFATGGMVYDPAAQEIVFTASVPGSTWGKGAVGASSYNGLRFAEVAGHPEGLVAGPNSSSDVFISLFGSERAGLFNLSRFALVASVRVNGTPAAMAYDPQTNEVDVTTTDTAQLFLLSASTLSYDAVVPVGGGPGAIAYDSATDSLWVANSNNVTVVSDRTHSVEAVLSATFGPAAVAVDPTDDRAYVATYDDQNLTVYNATSYRELAVVPIDPNPLGLLVDPATGDVFAACLNGTVGRVDVVSGASFNVLARLTVGNTPSNLLLDPLTNEVVVTNEFSSNLSLISPDSLRVVGAVKLSGFYPWGITYDPATQQLFLSDADLNIDTSTGNESSQLYALSASNYSLAGSVVVDPVTLGIAYSPASNLVFAASYLANTVDVVDPGTLTWNATIPVGDMPVPVLYDPGTSEVYVANSESANLTYLSEPPVTYQARFTENGLAGGEWAITIGTTTAAAPAGSPISFALPNGSYTYQVVPLSGYSTNLTGTISVEGAAVSVEVLFIPHGYPVTFSEVGLPSGTHWSVTFGGMTRSGTGDITFPGTPNGSASFTVPPPVGYYADPSTGTVAVDGAGVTVGITFQPEQPSPGAGPPGLGTFALVAVAAAAIVVAAVVVLLVRRAGKPPREPTRPSPFTVWERHRPPG